MSAVSITPDRNRIRIRLDSNRILSGFNSPPRPEPKTIQIKIGDATFNYPYWKTRWTNPKTRKIYYRFVVRFKISGQSRRQSFNTFKKARARAVEVAIAEANHETDRLQIGPARHAKLIRLEELERQAGASAELLISEAIAARQKAARSNFIRKTVPQVITEFIAQKDKDLKRKKWLRMLRKMLDRLGEYFTGPIDDLRSAFINDWLRSLSGGLVYRKHHRDAAVSLLRYASGRNFLSREWPLIEQELKLIDNPEPDRVKIITWTPEQLVKLLASTRDNMIPFTVLQAFAGIRHEEINPQAFDLAKRPLDWSDIDWEQKLIHIEEETAKTGQNRIIPIEDNLAAWLKPYRKQSGRICTVSNTSNALTKAKIRAGLPHGKNEARNVLRKTWISARLALGDEIGLVAERSGNSPPKIRDNYRRPMPQAMAKRLFGIRPDDGDIRQKLLGIQFR